MPWLVTLIPSGEAPMILCLCQGISDHSVRASIRGGAATLAEASRRRGAMPAPVEVGL